jgi:hypothetical protein
MKRPGPLLTLFAGLLLGLFMLSLNATAGTRADSYASNTPDTSNTSKSTKEPPAASASPSPAKSTASPSRSPSPSRAKFPDASYAGRTDDDSAAVAVSVHDGRAVAYFCDGRSKESWLKGDVQDDGTMRLTGANGARLDGTLQDGRRIRGTVDVGGHHAFTAEKADKPSGLYRAAATVRGARIDGGWIVLQNGRQVGVLNRDEHASSAPPVDPDTGAVTVDGQQLTAHPVTP